MIRNSLRSSLPFALAGLAIVILYFGVRAVSSQDVYRASDPPVGQPQPVLRVATLRTAKHDPVRSTERPCLLVFTDGCAQCSVATIGWMMREMTKVTPHLPAIMFVSPDASLYDKVSAKLGSGVKVRYAVIVPDHYLESCHAYNAQWFPRSYLIDAAGNIAYCQHYGESPARLAAKAEQIIKGKRVGR